MVGPLAGFNEVVGIRGKGKSLQGRGRYKSQNMEAGIDRAEQRGKRKGVCMN